MASRKATEKFMKVIALCQAYNEGLFMRQALSWITPLVDQIIITEGCLTPYGNQTRRSEDNTRQIIEDFQQNHDRQNKIKFFDAFVAHQPPNREAYEGMNKNFMLKKSDITHGDLIFILDVDEFWNPENFTSVIKRFRKNDKIFHIPVEEYQFAYNLRICFNAEHNGRFMRFVKGARFGDTNHFIYPDGKDVTKNYNHLTRRKDTQMCHLCWAKHPLHIKQKVESFNRLSFTTWYNHVYLRYPLDGNGVYQRNQQILPYRGSGFAEGQHEKLYQFKGELPNVIKHMNFDWMVYIQKYYQELVIK